MFARGCLVIGLLALAGLWLVVYLPVFAPEEALESDLVQHPTGAWAEFVRRGNRPDGRRLILSTSYIRRIEDGVVYFALRDTADYQVYPEDVYVYNVARRELRHSSLERLGVGERDWQWLSRPGSRPECLVEGAEGLRTGESCFATDGKTLVGIANSPSRDLRLVLSSRGDRPRPFRSLWSGEIVRGYGRAFGQHVAQVFSVKTERFLDPPVLVAITSSVDGSAIYWLGGDDLIAVAPDSHEWISVLHVADLQVR